MRYKANNQNNNPRNLVKYNRTVLDNGIKVVSETIPTVETIALGITINVGSRDDYSGFEGIAHFLEHSAFKRTSKHSAGRIASMFESIGAYTNGFTTNEHTCFYVRCLRNNYKLCLRLLTELVQDPIFKANEVEKERSIILDEISSYEDDPEEMIFELTDSLLYQGSGLANPILGTKKSVKKIGINQLDKFHKNFYNAQNIVISLAGNIEHELFAKKTNELIGSLHNPQNSSLRVASEPNKSHKLIEDKGFSQSHFVLAKRLRYDDVLERYAIHIINIIFGDGMSSRLYQNIREKFGLTYNIFSNIQLQSDSGAIYIYGACDPANLDKTMDEVYKQILKFKVKLFNKTEFARAKEQLKSSLIMDLESLSARMMNLAKYEFQNKEYEDVSSIINSIDSVNPDKVVDLINYYFDVENWTEVIFKSDL